jgi:hypothetical protein
MKGDSPLDWLLEGTPEVEPDVGRKLKAGLCALGVAVVPALYASAFAGVSDGVVLWALVVVAVSAFAFFLRVLPRE